MIRNSTSISCEALLTDLEGAIQQGQSKEILLYNLNQQTPPNLKDALYSIFCAKKHEITLNSDNFDSKHNIIDVHQKRLDNLLIAEGVTAAGMHSIFSTDAQTQFEYEQNFAKLREYFYSESKYCDDACQQITNQVMRVLQDQSLFRPISQLDYSIVLNSLNQKFAEIRTQLKLITCQRALTMRSRLMETRRRRRNFPKETTKILNEYFYTNYNQQYPTEEVKAMLAKQCGMTIAQVSNWFGNKRIRHNKYKNTVKGQKEMEMYTGRTLSNTEITQIKHSRMQMVENKNNYSEL